MAVFGFIATTLICFTLLSLPGTLPEEGQCLGSPNCCFLLKMCRQPFALKQHKKNKRGCVKLITMLKCTMTLYSIYIWKLQHWARNSKWCVQRPWLAHAPFKKTKHLVLFLFCKTCKTYGTGPPGSKLFFENRNQKRQKGKPTACIDCLSRKLVQRPARESLTSSVCTDPGILIASLYVHGWVGSVRRWHHTHWQRQELEKNHYLACN